MFFKFFSYALIWALIILVLSIVPGKDLPDFSLLTFDKAIHAFMYAVLAFLLNRGLAKQFRYKKLRYKVIKAGFVLPVIYGILIELIQHYFLADRTGDAYDVIANTIGAAAGILIFNLAHKKTFKHFL